MCVLEYKKQIENIIVSRMSKLHNVESIFVVGSMANIDYCEKEVNDYDIRILVSVIDDFVLGTWNDVIDECMKLACKFETLIVSFSDIIGPVKEVSKGGENVLLIHGIVLTQEALNGLGNIHKRSYFNLHYVLYGKNPIAEFDSLQIQIDNILDDIEGINYCIEHLSDKKISYLKWIKKDNEYSLVMHKEDFTDESGYEFVRYSISKAIMNINEYFRSSSNYVFNISEEIKEKIRMITELKYPEYTLDKDVYIKSAILVLDYLRRGLTGL